MNHVDSKRQQQMRGGGKTEEEAARLTSGYFAYGRQPLFRLDTDVIVLQQQPDRHLQETRKRGGREWERRGEREGRREGGEKE